MAANNFNDTVVTAVRYAGYDIDGNPNIYAQEAAAWMGVPIQNVFDVQRKYQTDEGFDLAGLTSALQAMAPADVMQNVAHTAEVAGTARDLEQKNSAWDQGPLGGFGTALMGTGLIAGAGALGGAFGGTAATGETVAGGAGTDVLAGGSAADTLAAEAAGEAGAIDAVGGVGTGVGESVGLDTVAPGWVSAEGGAGYAGGAAADAGELAAAGTAGLDTVGAIDAVGGAGTGVGEAVGGKALAGVGGGAADSALMSGADTLATGGATGFEALPGAGGVGLDAVGGTALSSEGAIDAVGGAGTGVGEMGVGGAGSGVDATGAISTEGLGTDAEGVDMGTVDTGTTDTSTIDSEGADMGATDTGTSDTSATDAEGVDMGTPDTGASSGSEDTVGSDWSTGDATTGGVEGVTGTEDRSKWTTAQWNDFIKAAIAAATLAAGTGAGAGTGTVAKTADEIAADTAKTNAAKIANEQWDYWKSNYKPLEISLIKQATDAGSQDEFARARGAANADVTGAFDTARRNAASRMQSYGLNPGSAAFQSGMGSTDIAEGATKAGALTTADNTTRALAFGKQFDVANLGKGIPSQSAAAATNAANAATNAANVAGINQNRQYLQNNQNMQNLGYGLNTIGNAAARWFGSDSGSSASDNWGFGYAEGGVIDAEKTAPGEYDATALKSVMMRHGLNDATASAQANGVHKRMFTPHQRVFASGGGVGRQGMNGPNDASMMNQPVNGEGTETSDSIPATINGEEPAALSDGEFVVNAAAVDLTGEEMLAAINQAGLRKRQQVGLEPQTSNDVSANAGAQAYADGGEAGYGTRLDGTQKGQGYFGALPNAKGVPSTELSFDFDVDGKKILAPLLVPTLSPQEIQHLLENKPPTESIYRKAQDHAMQRIRSGKNPFAMKGEQAPTRQMQMPAQAYARGGRVNRYCSAGL